MEKALNNIVVALSNPATTKEKRIEIYNLLQKHREDKKFKNEVKESFEKLRKNFRIEIKEKNKYENLGKNKPYIKSLAFNLSSLDFKKEQENIENFYKENFENSKNEEQKKKKEKFLNTFFAEDDFRYNNQKIQARTFFNPQLFKNEDYKKEFINENKVAFNNFAKLLINTKCFKNLSKEDKDNARAFLASNEDSLFEMFYFLKYRHIEEYSDVNDQIRAEFKELFKSNKTKFKTLLEDSSKYKIVVGYYQLCKAKEQFASKKDSSLALFKELQKHIRDKKYQTHKISKNVAEDCINCFFNFIENNNDLLEDFAVLKLEKLNSINSLYSNYLIYDNYLNEAIVDDILYDKKYEKYVINYSVEQTKVEGKNYLTDEEIINFYVLHNILTSLETGVNHDYYEGFLDVDLQSLIDNLYETTEILSCNLIKNKDVLDSENDIYEHYDGVQNNYVVNEKNITLLNKYVLEEREKMFIKKISTTNANNNEEEDFFVCNEILCGYDKDSNEVYSFLLHVKQSNNNKYKYSMQLSFLPTGKLEDRLQYARFDSFGGQLGSGKASHTQVNLGRITTNAHMHRYSAMEASLMENKNVRGNFMILQNYLAQIEFEEALKIFLDECEIESLKDAYIPIVQVMKDYQSKGIKEIKEYSNEEIIKLQRMARNFDKLDNEGRNSEKY